MAAAASFGVPLPLTATCVPRLIINCGVTTGEQLALDTELRVVVFVVIFDREQRDSVDEPLSKGLG